MLSQAMYWMPRAIRKDGYFYKTAEEWTEETGLSYKEQVTARKRLNEHSWWHEKLIKANGSPTVHYYVDGDELDNEIRQMRNMESYQSADSNLTNRQKPYTETTTETTTTTTTGGDSGKVFKLWEQNMPGTMTPILADMIHDMIKETSVASVCEGIRVAVESGVRKPNYVRGVAVRHASGEGKPGGKADVNLQSIPTEIGY